MARNTARVSRTAADDNAWWAPKRFGYGTGLPIAWQGWAVTLAYCLTVALGAYVVLPHSILGFVAIMLAATGTFILVCARKTRGGWKWRWGNGD